MLAWPWANMTKRTRPGIRPSSWVLAASAVAFAASIGLIVLKFTHRSPETQTALFGVVRIASEDQTLLARSNYFSSSTVGYADVVTREQRAWARIREEPDAAEQFRALADSSNPAAVLWGLAGLYRSDPSAFRKARQHYQEDSRRVSIHVGCVSMEWALGPLLYSGAELVQDLNELMDDPPPDPVIVGPLDSEF